MSKHVVVSVATFVAAQWLLSTTYAQPQTPASSVSSDVVCDSGYVDVNGQCVIESVEPTVIENDSNRAKELRKALESVSDSQEPTSSDGSALTDDEESSAPILDSIEPPSQERDCGGKAGRILCAHDRLTEQGFPWVIPAFFVLILGTVALYAAMWIWMVMHKIYEIIRRK